VKTMFYQAVHSAFVARANCENGNQEWFARHTERIEQLCKEHAPSGSGFDNGTQFNMDASSADVLVFNTAFHHMSEHGFYDGWTEHAVRVRPDWHGVRVSVSGRNRNGIKDYIAEVFHGLASVEVKRGYGADE
jgi:hypothetical protein